MTKNQKWNNLNYINFFHHFKKSVYFFLITSIFIILFSFSASADAEQITEAEPETLVPGYEQGNMDDIAVENAYALRMQYAREMMRQDAENARIQLYAKMQGEYQKREELVDYALSFVGVTPYVWGGGSLYYGTDCSGFVSLIFASFGYSLPTGSDAYQYSVGYQIPWDERAPGDIIVYGNGAHVGIYAGGDMVVHCSSPENGTVCWNLWYRNDMTCIVRVLEP